jgi:phospholipid/cholesterol/gamma-HCH transport system substrate-binding protein
MLGERYIAVDPGRANAMLPDGGRLDFGEEPGDFDAITREVERISVDIKAITGALREVVENDKNTEHVEATLANVDALSLELRLLAEQNRADITAIVDSVRRLSESLEDFTAETSSDVDQEMDKLHEATDQLNAALEDVESITGKIDRGEGTLGALVNDRETIDSLNETLDNANAVIESFSGMHAEVYYIGRVYVGTQPGDPAFFYGNPLAPAVAGSDLGYAGSNTLGMELHPQEDFWWVFEVNDYPQGAISAEEHYFPELGTSYTEWTRKIDYRFTFQMSKRWWDLAFRLGVKENGGGVGITWYGLNDRLTVSGDAFDFAFGSYPALEAAGTPNLRLALRAEPIDRIWLEAGAEQLLLGARYGYATGFIGAGFHFTDDDVKLLFATLPLGL